MSSNLSSVCIQYWNCAVQKNIPPAPTAVKSPDPAWWTQNDRGSRCGMAAMTGATHVDTCTMAVCWKTPAPHNDRCRTPGCHLGGPDCHVLLGTLQDRKHPLCKKYRRREIKEVTSWKKDQDEREKSQKTLMWTITGQLWINQIIMVVINLD